MAPSAELSSPSPSEACSGHDGWNSLPQDLLLKACLRAPLQRVRGGGGMHMSDSKRVVSVCLQVGALLSGEGHTLSGMRGACSSWRDAAAGLEAELAPLGATPYLAAFPQVTSIDYARRGQGHSLRDEDLALVCAGEAGRLPGGSAPPWKGSVGARCQRPTELLSVSCCARCSQGPAAACAPWTSAARSS